jgi:hypothetical protein
LGWDWERWGRKGQRKERKGRISEGKRRKRREKEGRGKEKKRKEQSEERGDGKGREGERKGNRKRKEGEEKQKARQIKKNTLKRKISDMKTHKALNVTIIHTHAETKNMHIQLTFISKSSHTITFSSSSFCKFVSKQIHLYTHRHKRARNT